MILLKSLIYLNHLPAVFNPLYLSQITYYFFAKLIVYTIYTTPWFVNRSSEYWPQFGVGCRSPPSSSEGGLLLLHHSCIIERNNMTLLYYNVTEWWFSDAFHIVIFLPLKSSDHTSIYSVTMQSYNIYPVQIALLLILKASLPLSGRKTRSYDFSAVDVIIFSALKPLTLFYCISN